MNWTDDELMAFADGELAGERSEALAAALAGDAGLRGRVAALQRQRQAVAAAFASALDEPVPDRLTALLAAPSTSTAPSPVVDLAAERTKREKREKRSAGQSWARWGGMAASLLLGVLMGSQMGPWLKAPAGAPSGDALLSEAGGELVAGGRLAQALETRLAQDTPAASADGGIAVQLSFIDKDGQYCRTFSADRIAGLACRETSRWAVRTTTPAEHAASGAMRQAASPLPRALLDAVDSRIDGTALTAAQEQGARDRGWRR